MIAGPLLLALVAVNPGAADDAGARMLAVDGVTVARVAQVPQVAADAQWARVTPSVITLHAQRAVHLNDAVANAAIATHGAVPVQVQALHDDTTLALLLSWPDTTEDRVSPIETAAFADEIAVEVPQSFGAGKRLPYIGMGDDGAPVGVWLSRAIAAGSLGRTFVAAGFGSLTRAKLPARMALDYDAKAHAWHALFVRPLDVAGTQSLRTGLVPFGLAVWNGAIHERGGNKALSQWKFLKLEGFDIDTAYLVQMSYGYGAGDLGDPARGKTLTETVCIACHHVGDKRMALPGYAPDLSSVGAVSTYSYLRDSIMDPSLVLVPTININRHVDRTKPTDASGAYPNSLMYAWSVTGADGKRASKMTSFAGLPPADVAALVAYLKTLGTEQP